MVSSRFSGTILVINNIQNIMTHVPSTASQMKLKPPSPELRKSSRSKAKDSRKETVERKDDILAFQILPQSVCKELLEMDVDEMQRRLCEFFKLNNWATNLKEAAILDYYTGAVWWAKEQYFGEQGMSGFFTAVYILLENVKDKHMSLVDNMKELKKMLVGIGIETGPNVPSGGLEFFDVADGQAISKYIFDSLFQHYRLYEFMFSHPQTEEIISTEVTIEVPKPATMPFPPPLDEGIEKGKFELYVKSSPEALPTDSAVEKQMEKEFTMSTFDMDLDIFSRLTAQDVREIVESVAAEMLGGLQNEVTAKLREKENAILSKINKIQKVAADQ